MREPLRRMTCDHRYAESVFTTESAPVRAAETILEDRIELPAHV